MPYDDPSVKFTQVPERTMSRIAAWAGDPLNVEMTRCLPDATWQIFDHRNYGMKKLAATIVLLCMSNAALAHDIYSNLRDRDGNLCCGGQDCKPVQALPLPNGSYYLPESDETISHLRATTS